jgi:hypothetical protein
MVTGAIHDLYPDAPTGPFFLPWTATDSRFLRQQGIASYGFAPFPILTTDTVHVDNANERIGLPGFAAGVDLYRKVVGRIASPDR